MDLRTYLENYKNDPLFRFNKTTNNEGSLYDPLIKYNTQLTTIGAEYDPLIKYKKQITSEGLKYDTQIAYNRKITEEGLKYDPEFKINKKITNDGNYYKGQFNSFSGSDIVATIVIPDLSTSKSIVIGELQTISYSIHRPKVQVRTLGRINPKGFVKCGRTIAGSLVFTVFDRHIVHELLDDTFGEGNRIITDEMPPFNVTVSFVNEYGQQSVLRIYGIEIVNEGQTMSIEDMITENVMNYVANGIDLMTVDTSRGTVKTINL